MSQRLSHPPTSGADCWGQTFTLDNVANLTGIALSKCSGSPFTGTPNQNNQFPTYTYDAAGNLTNDGLYTYNYDAENQMTSSTAGATYTYDGNRRRAAKSNGRLYWRTTDGNVIAETNLSGTDLAEYVFFGGRRAALIDGSGNVYYYQADQVGSTRTITNSSGALCYDADFTPFGAEISHTNTCAQNYKFTGYERDSETGLDYAMNRYYNSRIGRFMSADPSGIASAAPGNPQSLHRYAYVLNNPLIGIDPLGLECVFIDSGGDTVEEVDATDPNDHGTGTDSASCASNGGYFFDGNNEVNNDNYAQDGGNWGRFDIDPDSNWVGLTDDNGNSTGQFNCQGSACGYNSLASFALGEGLFQAANNGTQPQQPQKPQPQPNPPKPLVSPNACLYWQAANWWGRGLGLGFTASGAGVEVGVPLLIVNLASTTLQSSFCSGGGATHW